MNVESFHCPGTLKTISDTGCRRIRKNHIDYFGDDYAKFVKGCPCKMADSIPLLTIRPAEDSTPVGADPIAPLDEVKSTVEDMNVLTSEKKEEVDELLRQGLSIREIVKKSGVAKNTIARAKRLLTEAGEVINCACGKEWGHGGWCKNRYQKSEKRQDLVKSWHPETQKVEPEVMENIAVEDSTVGKEPGDEKLTKKMLIAFRKQVEADYGTIISTLIAERDSAFKVIDRLMEWH